MPRPKTRIQVGSDWSQCPYCHCTYRTVEEHHPACPISKSTALCRYCGITFGHSHDIGCPHSTGLFPITNREIDGELECANCDALFKLGDCFVAGKAAILCVGCAWVESNESTEAGEDNDG